MKTYIFVSFMYQNLIWDAKMTHCFRKKFEKSSQRAFRTLIIVKYFQWNKKNMLKCFWTKFIYLVGCEMQTTSCWTTTRTVIARSHNYEMIFFASEIWGRQYYHSRIFVCVKGGLEGSFTLVRSSKHVPDHYPQIFNINWKSWDSDLTF